MTTTHKHEHDFSLGPSPEDLARCVHCGFCLEACPTYMITRLETESPRGRIQLARAITEGRIEPTPNVISHFDLCLQCRACETACPSGVLYGRIIEGTRAMIAVRPDRPRAWKLRSLVLRLLFRQPWRLRLAFAGLKTYQRSPLSKVVRRLLPSRLRKMEEMMPLIPDRRFRGAAVAGMPAAQVKATVALLEGCVMPLLQPETHEATVRVLARNGCKVLVPQGQGCCGALHLHNGDREPARQLARRNIDVFLGSGADYIAVNAAGCGSAMKEYGELFAYDRAYADKARRFAERVRDVNELLVEIGFEKPSGPVETRVTYQDSCHLAHAQRVRSAPRELLRSIPGLDLVEMTTPDRCCGSAGIYNLTQTDMSRQVLDDKMDDCLATGCDVIATANPGCVLQLQLGVRQRGSGQEVLHVVELLDEAYRAEHS